MPRMAKSVDVQDKRLIFAPCKIRISHIHVGRITQCQGQFSAPAKSALPPSLAVMAKSVDVQDERLIFAPCKIRISHIHVGRMTQCQGQFSAPAKTALPPSRRSWQRASVFRLDRMAKKSLIVRGGIDPRRQMHIFEAAEYYAEYQNAKYLWHS